MKRYISLVLILALGATMLTGCRKKQSEEPAQATSNEGPGYVITDQNTPEPTARPDETLSPEEKDAEKQMAYQTEQMAMNEGTADASIAPPGGEDEPVVVPNVGDEIVMGTYDESTDAQRHTPTSSVIDVNSIMFTAVQDENVDFTFNHPADWENVPGLFTVCYRKKVEGNTFPPRIAITRKKLVHTPEDDVLMNELISYIKSIRSMYDKSTFQAGTPRKDETFMGKPALSNTYLAYWGDTEVKGYIVGAAVGRTLYVLHFCASYDDYNAYRNVLSYMVQSAKSLIEEEKK